MIGHPDGDKVASHSLALAVLESALSIRIGCVVTTVTALFNTSISIVYWSTNERKCRKVTKLWLATNKENLCHRTT